jgi:hypothetical protein
MIDLVQMQADWTMGAFLALVGLLALCGALVFAGWRADRARRKQP